MSGARPPWFLTDEEVFAEVRNIAHGHQSDYAPLMTLAEALTRISNRIWRQDPERDHD